MENASKALLMAGGILISLLVVGALVLMFVNLGDYQNNVDNSRKSSQIADFNNQFMPYDKENLTLMELKSLYNKIESNNKTTDYKIKTNIKDIYPKIENDFKGLPEEDKQNRRYKCIKIEYGNEDGRISLINFEKQK